LIHIEEKTMNILICIDDTDNLESKGTGHLAEILRHDIEKLYGGKTSRITRHQLFVSDEIPYTSHNSAMCFNAEIDAGDLPEMIEYSGKLLENKSAIGSDPGLCVAVTDSIKSREELIEYGLDATKKVLTKNDALSLAAKMNIHLSEHGGTGGGIIGALAGIGLRLSGNNGRFKGWIPVNESEKNIRVKDIVKRFDIHEVRSIDGYIPHADDEILLNDRIKTVLLDGKSVLLVKKKEDKNLLWENLGKEELRKY
jgi:hypothetical protein